MAKKLILLGDSLFAEIAYEYFSDDSDYEVVGFALEKAYIHRESLFDLPIVAFEEVEKHFAPAEHFFYASLVYTQLNRLRTRMYQAAKAKGYRPASYISSKAFVWRNVEVGEHCFIFEDNTIQPFVKIEENVVLWSGNHIGHHSRIQKNCFISSHVVVSGSCNIGENCFFGVNACLGNDVSVGADCLIGAGATVTKNLPENTLVKGNKADIASFGAREYFKLPSLTANHE